MRASQNDVPCGAGRHGFQTNRRASAKPLQMPDMKHPIDTTFPDSKISEAFLEFAEPILGKEGEEGIQIVRLPPRSPNMWRSRFTLNSRLPPKRNVPRAAPIRPKRTSEANDSQHPAVSDFSWHSSRATARTSPERVRSVPSGRLPTLVAVAHGRGGES